MNERHVRVLHMVAESYIATARPVASQHIADRLDVSSATVRNDFGMLEQGGLLQQPHTSAGRIPTASGFRFYAASHLPPRRLPKRAREVVARQLAGADGDDVFQVASHLAAQLSGYAVLVRLPADQSLRVIEIHLSLLSSRRLLAVVVLENGLVRQLGVDLDPAPDDDVIDDAERNIRQLALSVGEVPTALRFLAKSTETDLGRTLRAVADAWGGLRSPRLFRDGLSRLLAEPEGQDPVFVRLVVEQVEEASEEAGELEGSYAVELDDRVAKISAAFGFGAGRGMLTLVGPARMRYPLALSIASEFGRALDSTPGSAIRGSRSAEGTASGGGAPPS